MYKQIYNVMYLLNPPPGPLHRAITKRLKLNAKTSHVHGPLPFAGKVTSTSPEIGGRPPPQTLVRSKFIYSILET